jgi:hypothetical protein
MSKLVVSLSPTLSLVWPFSVVVLLNSLPACGSLPLATPLAQQASRLNHLFFTIYYLIHDYPVGSVTAFTSYGAFWLSFATLLIPGSGVAAAYASSANPAQEADAIAIYLTAWMIITFLFLSVCCSFLIIPSGRTHSPVFWSSIVLQRFASLLA